MQIAEPRALATPSTRVLGPSLAFDLSWTLLAADSVYLRTLHPVLFDLYDQHPDLETRVKAFWESGPGFFAEMEVLALFGDLIDTTDIGTLRAGLESSLESISADIDLPSETEEVREVLFDRMAQLRRSATRREAYFTLLADVWAVVAPWWETDGAAAIERGAAQMREQLAQGRDWHRIVTTECEVFETQLPELVERHHRGDSVTLVPCALFGRGLYLDVNGSIVVGFAAAGPDDLARARTAQVVRRLRALADPTRIAIYDYLKVGPSSVSEIAKVFSLAQPTVSVHVKHLREAGLITSQRRGSRLEIAVDPTASAQLASEVGTLLRP